MKVTKSLDTEDFCLTRDEFIIVQNVEKEFKNPVVFITHPGPGIVGPMISREMIKSLDLKQIGFFKSKHLSPVTMFMDNILTHPYLLYSNKDGSIIHIALNYPVPDDAFLFVGEGLMRWIIKLDAKYVVCFDGLPVRSKPDDPIVITAAEPEVAEQLQEYHIEPFKNGVVTGFSGSIMSEALLNEIVGINLMTPAMYNIPDPEAAVELIKVVNSFFDLDIDTEELLEEAEKIKEQLDVINQRQRALQQQKQEPQVSRGTRESFV